VSDPFVADFAYAARSMRVGSLNHVVVTVNDLARSRAFYDKLLPALGYRRLFAEADSVGYQGADGMKLILAEAHEDTRGAVFDRYKVGLHHFAFNAPDRAYVDSVHSKLVEWGATVLDAPAEYPQYEAGYYAVFFLDPDGIKLEVVHV
jgi:catechol 2,3-dioxygenase-like lactoylglutathione lyase family enzyme